MSLEARRCQQYLHAGHLRALLVVKARRRLDHHRLRCFVRLTDTIGSCLRQRVIHLKSKTVMHQPLHATFARPRKGMGSKKLREGCVKPTPHTHFFQQHRVTSVQPATRHIERCPPARTSVRVANTDCTYPAASAEPTAACEHPTRVSPAPRALDKVRWWWPTRISLACVCLRVCIALESRVQLATGEKKECTSAPSSHAARSLAFSLSLSVLLAIRRLGTCN